MVARKPGSPGRARRKPLKPLRREGRVKPPPPVVTTTRVVFYLHARPRVPAKHPAFPAPSFVFRGFCFMTRTRGRRGITRVCAASDCVVASDSEAIQVRTKGMDCFVATAPRNDRYTSCRGCSKVEVNDVNHRRHRKVFSATRDVARLSQRAAIATPQDDKPIRAEMRRAGKRGSVSKRSVAAVMPLSWESVTRAHGK